MLSPAQIMERLEEIEQDLGLRQNELEAAADRWTRKQREKELAWAKAYVATPGSVVTDKKAQAILASAEIGIDEEANYVALSKVVDVLQTRTTIGQSLLRAHGRASS